MNYMEGLNQSISYIEDSLFDAPDYNRAAQIAGMSKSTYQRFFLAVAAMPLEEYIRKRRLQYAVQELTKTNRKVIDIAMQCGFDSASAFSRAVSRFTGCSPSQIRKNGAPVYFPRLNFQIRMSEGEMALNKTALVRIEERRNEKVVCFSVDCVDPENAAWAMMSAWCRENIPDRAARRFLGVAPLGHHPQGERHLNASEHVCHPYTAMMYLIEDERDQRDFHGKRVEDAPKGLFLVNEVALNQYDENGKLDVALSLMKASEAFVEFMKQTPGYTFDCGAGVFYEEHVFSEQWFQNGGAADGLRMWVPIARARDAMRTPVGG